MSNYCRIGYFLHISKCYVGNLQDLFEKINCWSVDFLLHFSLQNQNQYSFMFLISVALFHLYIDGGFFIISSACFRQLICLLNFVYTKMKGWSKSELISNSHFNIFRSIELYRREIEFSKTSMFLFRTDSMGTALMNIYTVQMFFFFFCLIDIVII